MTPFLSALPDRLIAIALIAALVFQPVMATAGSVPALNADPAASTANRPTVTAAANGVPMVYVTAPNGAGVSYNKFTDFNVGSQGLILNNSLLVGTSQLGGLVPGNPNFTGNTASLIVAEVTGSNRSLLTGYTEIFGQQAGYVLANPNGITCNGCGFINTPRVTLSTGVPQFDGTGALSSLAVNTGDVTLEGLGLDARNADFFDIVSRTATLNANLFASDLGIHAGPQSFVYATRTSTALTGIGTVPAVSIDSSLLGGLYANKITLVGTERGVGVNLQGQVISQGDLTLTADGHIQLASASAGNTLTAASTSADVTVTGSAYAAGTLSLSAGTTVSVPGVAAAAGDTALTASAVNIAGIVAAGMNGSGTVSAGTGTLTATAGTFVNSGSAVSGRATDVTAGTLTNTGTLASLGSVGLIGTAIGNQGTMAAGSSLAAVAASLDNAGTIGANTSLGIALTGNMTNRSGASITSGGGLSVSGSTLGNAGSITAGSNLTLTADTVANTSLLYAVGTLTAQVGTQFSNSGGMVLSGGDIAILGPGGGAAGSIVNSVGTLESVNGAISLNAAAISNVAQGATVDSAGNLTVATPSLISAGTTLTMTGGAITNTFGSISSGGSMIMTGQSLTNATITTPGMVNVGGTLVTYTHLASNVWQSPVADTNFIGVSTGGWSATCATVSGIICIHITGFSGMEPMTTNIYIPDMTVVSGGKILAGGSIAGSFTGQINNSLIAQNGSVATGTQAVRAAQLSAATEIDPLSLATVSGNALTGDGGLSSHIPGFTALFSPAPPASNVVYETRVAYNNLGTFYGSDYLVQQLGLNPSALPKRLGDAFFDTTLVADTLAANTGSRWVNPSFTDTSAQMKGLLDGAVQVAGQDGLTLGVPLTASQIANLKQSIVWYVDETVDGQRVLAPRLYLAPGTAADASATGATIAAQGDVTLTAGNLSGSYGSITAGGNLAVSAGQDIVLQASLLSAGGNIGLTAGHDLWVGTQERTEASMVYNESGSVSTVSLLHDASTVSSGGSLTATAGNNIGISGSSLTAGTDLSVTAGNALTVSSATNQTTTDSWHGDLHVTDMRQSNQASQLTAGGNIGLSSGSDLVIQASNAQAGGTLGLTSTGGQVGLLSAVDAYSHSEVESSNNGFWQSSTVSGYAGTSVVMDQLAAAKGISISAAHGVRADYRVSAGQAQSMAQALSQLEADPKTAWIAALANRDDVTWNRVQESYTSWYHHSEGLGPMAGMLISIAVAIATAGSGAALVGAAQGTLEAAVANAAFSTLAGQFVTGMVNNGGDMGAVFRQMVSAPDLTALAASMATAGVLRPVAAGTDFVSRLENAAVQNGIKSGIGLAAGLAQGQKVESAFTTAALMFAVGSLGQVGANYIGDGYQSGDLTDATHLATHAALGCAMGAAVGGGSGCGSGAAGAVAGEVAAQVVGTQTSDPSVIAGTAQAVATGLASVAGGNAAIAAFTAGNAVANNYLTHDQATLLQNAKDALGACSASGTCSTGDLMRLQGMVDTLTTLDQTTTANAQTACAAGGAACASALADIHQATVSYGAPVTAGDVLATSYQAQAQSLYASLYGGTSALTQIGAGVLNANTDYQLLTRAAGGVQALGGLGAAVAGSTAVVAGGAGSEAGVGIPVAVAGWLLTGYGADQTSAGLSTLLNGTQAATLGGSLLAQTGLSPQVSEMLYGLGGAALTGGAAVGVNALANVQGVGRLGPSLAATNSKLVPFFLPNGTTIEGVATDPPLAPSAPTQRYQITPDQAAQYLQQMGLPQGQIDSFVGSFQGPIYVRNALPGETFGAYSGGSQYPASGQFLTPGTAGQTSGQVVNTLALPPSNLATTLNAATINRPIPVLEGLVAPQTWSGAQSGGGWQVLVPGGARYGSNPPVTIGTKLN